MKSAFERAMEKFGGGELKDYTDDQKAELKDIDQRYEAKAVQARFDARRRLREAGGDPEKAKQIQDDLAVELASIEEKRDRDKQRLREQFDAANA